MAGSYAAVKRFLLASFRARKNNLDTFPAAEFAAMLVCENADIMAEDAALNSKVERWMKALRDKDSKKHLDAMKVLFEVVQEV